MWFLQDKYKIGTWCFDISQKQLWVCITVVLHQEEEEAAEGAQEAEGEGGAEDGPAWRLHRRHRRLIHVLPQHHQEAKGENLTHTHTLKRKPITLDCLVKSLYVRWALLGTSSC